MCDSRDNSVQMPAQENVQSGESKGKPWVLELNPLLRRALQFLEEGDRGKADDYCENVLDQEPENAYAYVIKLMIRLKVSKEEELGKVLVDYGDWNSYCNAHRYADASLRLGLESYLQSAREAIRLEEERRLAEEEARRQAEEEQRQEDERLRQASIFAAGMQQMGKTHTIENVREAYRCFIKVPDYEDSKARAEKCRQLIDELEEQEEQKKQEEERAREREEERKRKKRKIVLAVVALIVAVLVVVCTIVMIGNSRRAREIQEKLEGQIFCGTYSERRGDNYGIAYTITEYETEYLFQENSDVFVSTEKTVSFYGYSLEIIQNTVEEAETVKGGTVMISLFGNVTVTIDGNRYTLTVDEEDMPVSININDTEYWIQ